MKYSVDINKKVPHNYFLFSKIYSIFHQNVVVLNNNILNHHNLEYRVILCIQT